MSQNPQEGNPEFSPSQSTESPMNPGAMDHRKEVFRTLVTLQDAGETVQTSRARVAAEYDISREELADIEREGISQNWPPL